MRNCRVYTAGYMAGIGSDRFDWRKELESLVLAVEWLHPGVPSGAIPGKGNPDIYFARDVALIRHCDVVFAYLDLDVARCLGATAEMGIAYALGKPIIMVDKSPDNDSLDFNRKMSTSVWRTLDDAANVLQFIARGYND